jgi:hypothetical protein
MKVYWSLRSIPELADLSRAEQRRLWRECWWMVLDHWQVWLVFALGSLGLLGCMYLCMYLAAFLTILGGLGWLLAWLLALIVVSGLWGGIFSFTLDQVSIPLARPYLRAAREANRVPP